MLYFIGKNLRLLTILIQRRNGPHSTNQFKIPIQKISNRRHFLVEEFKKSYFERNYGILDHNKHFIDSPNWQMMTALMPVQNLKSRAITKYNSNFNLVSFLGPIFGFQKCAHWNPHLVPQFYSRFTVQPDFGATGFMVHLRVIRMQANIRRKMQPIKSKYGKCQMKIRKIHPFAESPNSDSVCCGFILFLLPYFTIVILKRGSVLFNYLIFFTRQIITVS